MSGPYRGGRVHSIADDAAITCHSTLYRVDVDEAVCRGFYDRYSTSPLRIAGRLGMIVEDPVPPKRDGEGGDAHA